MMMEIVRASHHYSWKESQFGLKAWERNRTGWNITTDRKIRKTGKLAESCANGSSHYPSARRKWEAKWQTRILEAAIYCSTCHSWLPAYSRLKNRAGLRPNSFTTALVDGKLIATLWGLLEVWVRSLTIICLDILLNSTIAPQAVGTLSVPSLG